MNIKWYHFWHPYSGLIGGCIFGLIISLAIVAIAAIASYLF